MIIKQPSGFTANLGDVINVSNGLISFNAMVIYVLSSTDTYIYLKTTLNQSITNRLVKWTKTTTITNLNQFTNQEALLNNFNTHPISVGYKLVDNDGGSLTIEPQFNSKTAYYNLQCKVTVTDSLATTETQQMEYIHLIVESSIWLVSFLLVLLIPIS